MTRTASLLLAAALALPAWPVAAHEGHDHASAAPAPTGNAPRRHADGSVFLPKPAQRQLAVRTVVAESTALPQAVELAGRVLMDPNAGGRVQPTLAGRIEAVAGGLPTLGQAVRRGQVLARVRVAASPIERGNQEAQAAELRAQFAIARQRSARLAQLEGSVPQKDIDAAQAEAAGLQQRLAAVSAAVAATEALVAPVDGVVSVANAVAGQVVDARELLFEIVDPRRLVVEALAFDTGLLADIGGASAQAAGGSVPLRFAGAGRAQREGAVPLLFRTDGAPTTALAVNQPVRVLVQRRTRVEGVPLPTSAVVKNASNQDMVWVHTEPEVFVPRTVRVQPLDGATVSVTDGLKPGERVVTQGAALVNQVR